MDKKNHIGLLRGARRSLLGGSWVTWAKWTLLAQNPLFVRRFTLIKGRNDEWSATGLPHGFLGNSKRKTSKNLKAKSWTPNPPKQTPKFPTNLKPLLIIYNYYIRSP
jgi:hypothetical protein